MTASRKIFLALVALGLALALVIGFHARRTRRDAERDTAELQRGRVHLAQRLTASETRLAVARERRARRENTKRPEPPATPLATTPTTTHRIPTANELIHAYPELESRYLDMMRSVTTRSFAPFFRVRNISESQAQQLLDAYAVLAAKRFDLDAVAEQQTDTAGKAAIAQLKQAAQAELLGAQKRILGEDGFAALNDYLGAGGVRFHVTSLAGEAAIAGIPLTAEQGEALTRVLVAAGRENIGEGRKQTVIDWSAVDAKARSILSPEQFALFQTTGVNFYNSRWSEPLDEAILKARHSDDAAKAGKKEPPRG